MLRTWIAAGIVALVGCGGKQEVTGPPEGRCSLGAGLWSCVPNDDAGASNDAGLPFTVLQCAANMGGSCSPQDTTVDTSNTNEPAHVSSGDCFQCTADGLGEHWTCVSQTWQSQGVYVCQ